jgi:hypothetical protein
MTAQVRETRNVGQQGWSVCWKRVSACPVVAFRVTAGHEGFKLCASDSGEVSAKSKLGKALRAGRGKWVNPVLAKPLLG